MLYSKYIKRLLDFCLSFLALVVLSPILLILIIFTAIVMKGNPIFVQERPGKDEKIFKLFKLRTMTCEKDSNGNPLPDDRRLTKYGKLLRSTSLDELPELVNILVGDMSIVGPRPLSVKYIDYYTEEEHKRHLVRPGLTGLAQVNGRNAISWEKKFQYDLAYINSISFKNDLLILLQTVKKVLFRENINQGEQAPISLHILREKERLIEK